MCLLGVRRLEPQLFDTYTTETTNVQVIVTVTLQRATNKLDSFTHTGTRSPWPSGSYHGLAGSGGVVVALAAASPTVASGAAFLIGFSVASIAAMGVASWVWGRAIGQARKLRVIAGVVSIAVGILLFMEIIGFAPSL